MTDRGMRPSALLSIAVMVMPAATCIALRLCAPEPTTTDTPTAGSAVVASIDEPVDALHPMPAPAQMNEMVARISALRDAATTVNPFYFPAELEPLDIPIDLPDLQPEQKIPDFRLTGFLSGTTPMAIIDGRPRRAGDAVAPGWLLISINPANRSIIVTGPDGYTLRLQPGEPSQRIDQSSSPPSDPASGSTGGDPSL